VTPASASSSSPDSSDISRDGTVRAEKDWSAVQYGALHW
jgi:hypothetical protein